MRSWTLGSISGIRIRVHWTFILLPIWIYFSSILAGTGVAAAITTVVFVLAIFGCVLLHELGHALAARQFGIGTRDITLLPIGGVAALERMPRKPSQELWIAAAGPLVNVIIAAALFGGLLVTSAGSVGVVSGFLWQLAIANVALVVFNLVPAFPMDGGRIMRSILAMFMDWVRATRIAVSLGKFTAIAFGLLGILTGNLILVLIAAFVFFAAQGELMAATAFAPDGRVPDEHTFQGDNPERSHDDGEWFRDDSSTMITGDDDSVPATLSTNSVAAWLANRRADYVRVVESGRTIGTLSKEQLMIALSRGFGNTPVGSLFR